ncbi:MAG: hypothetical protein ABIQ89_03565 [Candidatus Saccharimonadales bacterium]
MGWFGSRSKQPATRQVRNPRASVKPVISYQANQTIRAETSRGDDRVKPVKNRQTFWQRTWVRNSPSLVALFAICLCVLYCLGLSTDAKVVVAGDSPQAIVLRDKKDYQQGAQQLLSRSLLNRTKFTVNSGGFEKTFKEEFPEVADVSLSLPLVSRRPVVTISTAQPQMIMTAGGQAYVLDKRGTVIMPAKDLSSTIRDKLPVVNDQTGLAVDIGKTVLPAEQISFITTVMGQLKAKQIAIETATLPAAANEFDIKLAGLPYFVKFNLTSDAREAVGSLLATKRQLESMNATPAQYIDVRIAGRAYYQ